MKENINTMMLGIGKAYNRPLWPFFMVIWNGVCSRKGVKIIL